MLWALKSSSSASRKPSRPSLRAEEYDPILRELSQPPGQQTRRSVSLLFAELRGGFWVFVGVYVCRILAALANGFWLFVLVAGVSFLGF